MTAGILAYSPWLFKIMSHKVYAAVAYCGGEHFRKIVTAAKTSIAGLAWDYDALGVPMLLSGIYTDANRNLYSLSLDTGSMAQVHSMGSDLDRSVFGLASVPELATLVLLGLGAVSLLRKRKTQ